MKDEKRSAGPWSRREAVAVIAGAIAALGLDATASKSENMRRSTVKVTCFIRYQIDPFQLEGFRKYAEQWGKIIPRCGGHLIGYFLPHEGTNDVAWGLIAFDSLAAYETYRSKLRCDQEARENFQMAQSKRLILREERTFVEIVEGTFAVPSKLELPS